MSLALRNKVDLLRDRALMLARSRAFFSSRNVLEVDVPILSPYGSVDVHIDLIEARCCHKSYYLHSSPEYGMKRLLAEGCGDIYQISHVFRDHETGSRHTPEFVMVEWYRLGFTFQQMIDETVAFVRLFLEDLPSDFECITYSEAFSHHIPASMEERDRQFALEIEPHLGRDCITVITDFPPEQAALSQIGPNNTALRFEVFYKGMELANGYRELIDPIEQHRRLEEANEKRKEIGKNSYPIDEGFLAALEKGLPDCCGVAVGFDRLLMLRNHLETIDETRGFSF